MQDFSTRETISTQSIRPIESLAASSMSGIDIPGIDLSDKRIRPSIAHRDDGLARLNALLSHTTLTLKVSVNGVKFSIRAICPGRTADTIICTLAECDASIEVKSTVPLMLYIDSPIQFRGTLT